MPTSATGTSATSHRRGRAGRCAPRSGGFTLIEILVVVVIIGVVTAGTVLAVSLTGRDRELEKERDRMLALLTYAREQAELQTREYGVLFKSDGYRFVSFDARHGDWRLVQDDDALVPRTLPAGLDLKLNVDARDVVLGPATRDPNASPTTTGATEGADLKPQLMIFSNRDLSSFRITLERDGGTRSVTITADESGGIVALPMVEQRP